MRLLIILLFSSIAFGQVQGAAAYTVINGLVNQDPTDNANYVGRYDPTSIGAGTEAEDDALTVWNNINTSGISDMTLSGVILHVESGQRQVDFDGDGFGSIPDADVDYVPGTDAFTIAGRIGYDGMGSGTSECVFAKAQLNMSTTSQYALWQQSSIRRINVGGTQQTNGTIFNAGDIFVLTVRTTGADLYINNTKVLDNVAIGTVTTTNDLIIGARNDGSSFETSASLSHFYIKNQAIDATEATALYDWMTP